MLWILVDVVVWWPGGWGDCCHGGYGEVENWQNRRIRYNYREVGHTRIGVQNCIAKSPKLVSLLM